MHRRVNILASMKHAFHLSQYCPQIRETARHGVPRHPRHSSAEHRGQRVSLETCCTDCTRMNIVVPVLTRFIDLQRTKCPAVDKLRH